MQTIQVHISKNETKNVSINTVISMFSKDMDDYGESLSTKEKDKLEQVCLDQNTYFCGYISALKQTITPNEYHELLNESSFKLLINAYKKSPKILKEFDTIDYIAKRINQTKKEEFETGYSLGDLQRTKIKDRLNNIQVLEEGINPYEFNNNLLRCFHNCYLTRN